MGVLLSSLCTRCINLWSRLSEWLPYRPWWAGGPYQKPPRDVEKGESKAYGPIPKRRALLVGIDYRYSTDPIWTPLDDTHGDVDRFLELLICVYIIHQSHFLWPLIPVPGTYGYSPEDIVVLKDDPSFSNRLQPTRANMVESYSLSFVA
jgi:hypothetical protein